MNCYLLREFFNILHEDYKSITLCLGFILLTRIWPQRSILNPTILSYTIVILNKNKTDDAVKKSPMSYVILSLERVPAQIRRKET